MHDREVLPQQRLVPSDEQVVELLRVLLLVQVVQKHAALVGHRGLTLDGELDPLGHQELFPLQAGAAG